MPHPNRLLFLHIPKTAGTSLKHYLFNRLSAQECLLDPDPCAVQEANLDDYALVAGHLDFDCVGRYRKPPFVLTCLRNPLERALSAYHYQRTPRLRVQIESLAPQIGASAVAEILDDLRRLNACDSLATYLRREPELAQRTLGNVQTRFLAGASAAVAHAHQPQRLLTLAKDHLQACAGILLTEFMSESIEVLGPQLGRDEFGALTHDNVTPRRPSRADLDSDTIAALAELTSLDLELYRFSEELWRERMQGDRDTAATPARLPDELPDAADFTFDQPIRGRGWHIREQAPQGWFCWSDCEATLHLALTTTGPHVLRLWVEHVASPGTLGGLNAHVNGTSVVVLPKTTGMPLLMEGRVPPEALKSGVRRVCVELGVPHMVRPSERDPANPDDRRLGIALARLQLQPCD